MNRILFHSLFVAALVFSFAACQKKKDSKSSKAKPVQAQDQNQANKPTPEVDVWLNSIVKMTDETSHVYREILVRVFRGQDTDYKPQTIFYVTQQALAQFASGQNVIKNPKVWETEVELKDPKMKVKFFLKKPAGRGDNFYQLSFGTLDDRKALVSFELKSEKEVRMSVSTSQFADLTEKGLAIALHSNFHCDYQLEASGDKLMSEVRCEKIPFVQSPEKVIVGNEFFYTRNNEGAVELKGDVFTVGTRNQTVELKVAHVGKISVIEKDLYEKAEPIAVAKPAPAVANADSGLGNGKGANSNSNDSSGSQPHSDETGMIDANPDESSTQSLNGAVDSLRQKANPKLAPNAHAKDRDYDPDTGELKEVGSDLNIQNPQGAAVQRLNQARAEAPNAPGTQAEMEGLADAGTLEVTPVDRRVRKKQTQEEMAESMRQIGIDVPETTEVSDQELNQAESSADEARQNQEEEQQGQSEDQEQTEDSAQFPPPFDSDLQGAPQQ